MTGSGVEQLVDSTLASAQRSPTLARGHLLYGRAQSQKSEKNQLSADLRSQLVPWIQQVLSANIARYTNLLSYLPPLKVF